VRETHGFTSLPLLVRPNTVVALGASDSRPDYDYGDGTTFVVGALDDGITATATVPTLTGVSDRTVTVTRAGDLIAAEVQGGAFRPWRLLLLGVSAATIEGGTAEATTQGLIVTAAAGGGQMEVQLA
jgi:alpha-D-xyloside xylohydrolase